MVVRVPDMFSEVRTAEVNVHANGLYFHYWPPAPPHSLYFHYWPPVLPHSWYSMRVYLCTRGMVLWPVDMRRIDHLFHWSFLWLCGSNSSAGAGSAVFSRCRECSLPHATLQTNTITIGQNWVGWANSLTRALLDVDYCNWELSVNYWG
jgi:hypothetical protein